MTGRQLPNELNIIPSIQWLVVLIGVLWLAGCSETESDDEGPNVNWFGVEFSRTDSADFSVTSFPFTAGETWLFNDLDSTTTMSVTTTAITFQNTFPALRLTWSIAHPIDTQLSGEIETLIIARGIDDGIYVLGEQEFNEERFEFYNPRLWLPASTSETSSWQDHRLNSASLSNTSATSPHDWLGTLQINSSVIGRDAIKYFSQHSDTEGALVAFSRSIVAFQNNGGSLTREPQDFRFVRSDLTVPTGLPDNNSGGGDVTWLGTEFNSANSDNLENTSFPFSIPATWNFDESDSDATLQLSFSTDTFTDGADTVSIPAIKLIWTMTLPNDNAIIKPLSSSREVLMMPSTS